MNDYQKLNNIALPLMANAFLGLVLGLVDKAMVGRISPTAFGAIGVVNSLMFTITGILGAVSIAFLIHGSKSIGQGNKKLFLTYFHATLLIDIFIGIVLFLVLLLFRENIMTGIYQFTGEMLKLATEYLAIISIYPLVQLLLFTFSSYFKITKKTKWIFIGSLFSALLNLLFNYLLIFGNFGFPRLGVRGAALATIISLSVNLLIYCWLCRKELGFALQKMEQVKFLLKESVPFVSQEILEGSIFIVGLHGMIARIGNLELVGYILVMQLVEIILIPMYMYGSACLTLISEETGREQINILRKISRKSYQLVMLLFSVFSLLSLIFSYELVGFLSTDKQLVNYGISILGITILANIFNPLQTVYKSALQGIGKSKFVLAQTFIVNVLAFFIMLLLAFVFHWGFTGVLFGLFFNYGVLSFVFLRVYGKLV